MGTEAEGALAMRQCQIKKARTLFHDEMAKALGTGGQELPGLLEQAGIIEHKLGSLTLKDLFPRPGGLEEYYRRRKPDGVGFAYMGIKHYRFHEGKYYAARPNCKSQLKKERGMLLLALAKRLGESRHNFAWIKEQASIIAAALQLTFTLEELFHTYHGLENYFTGLQPNGTHKYLGKKHFRFHEGKYYAARSAGRTEETEGETGGDENHLAQLERTEKGKLQELQTQIEAEKRKKRKLQDLYHAAGLPEGGGSTEDRKTWLERQIAAAARLVAQRKLRAQRQAVLDIRHQNEAAQRELVQLRQHAVQEQRLQGLLEELQADDDPDDDPNLI